MKITIGVPHMTEFNHCRFSDAEVDLMAYSLSVGIDLSAIRTYRDNITFARNKIASKFLESGNDYLLFLDDDMVFKPDLLESLLKRKEKIVGGMTFIRSEPHEPSFYKLNSDGVTYNPIYLWKKNDLVECDAIGMAATLIHKSVFEEMKNISQFHKDIWGFFDNLNFTGEDLRFCRKARDLGFKVYCDTSQLVGHITEKVIGFGDYKAMAEHQDFNIKKHRAIKEYGK